MNILKLVVLILTGTSLWAQIPFQASNWKKFRKEVFFNQSIEKAIEEKREEIKNNITRLNSFSA